MPCLGYQEHQEKPPAQQSAYPISHAWLPVPPVAVKTAKGDFTPESATRSLHSPPPIAGFYR